MSQYDRSDPYWRVIRLTRAGHHLWREKSRPGRYLGGERVVWEALETIWQAKREVKAEIVQEKAEETARMRARFKRVPRVPR